MWQVFKELIWDKFWGKVFSVIGFLSLLYSLYLIVNPDSPLLRIPDLDDRLWYLLGYVFLIVTVFLALNGARKIKNMYEQKAINLMFNHIIHSTCHEVTRDGIEIFRAGFRSFGLKPVHNPVVIIEYFFRIEDSKTLLDERVPCSSLSMLVPVNTVNQGATPACWFNIFRHRLKSNIIEFCLDGMESYKVELTPATYYLRLVGRGEGVPSTFLNLNVTVDDNFSISVTDKDQPWLSA